MIVVNKDRTINCCYSENNNNLWIVLNNDLYCNDTMVQDFLQREEAIQCLNNIRKACYDNQFEYYI